MITFGLAVNEATGTPGLTVNVADALPCPLMLLQVREYSVVVIGETMSDPDVVPPVLNPVPVHDVARAEPQVSVED